MNRHSSTAHLLEALGSLISTGKLDGRGAVDVLRATAMQLRSDQPVALHDVFRGILARGRAVGDFPNHLTTPCCGQPMVPIGGGNVGRPCVMFNPYNEVVQCHRCGATWGPVLEPFNPNQPQE